MPSGAPRTNHTSDIPHLAGSTRDVGSADHCEFSAEVLRRCGLCNPWSLTRWKIQVGRTNSAPPAQPGMETLSYLLIFTPYLCAQGEECHYSHDQKPFRPSPFFPARDFFDQFLSAAEQGSFFKATTESSTGGDAMSGCVHFNAVAIALASDKVAVMMIIPKATSSTK